MTPKQKEALEAINKAGYMMFDLEEGLIVPGYNFNQRTLQCLVKQGKVKGNDDAIFQGGQPQTYAAID
ncbi:MAG: hypothetical protein V3R25_05750 [Nitrosomonadaceae bacterium]